MIKKDIFFVRWLVLVFAMPGVLAASFFYASSVQALTCSWTEETKEWVNTSYQKWVDEGSYQKWVDEGSYWKWVDEGSFWFFGTYVYMGHWEAVYVGHWEAVYVGHWETVSSGYYKTTSVPKSETCPSDSSTSCSYSSVCSESGTKTTTTYSCGGRGCVSSESSASCSRDTDGDSCGTNKVCGSGSCAEVKKVAPKPKAGSSCTSDSECNLSNYEVCFDNVCTVSGRQQREGDTCSQSFQCVSDYWVLETRYQNGRCSGGSCAYDTTSCEFGRKPGVNECNQKPVNASCLGAYPIDKTVSPDCFGARYFDPDNSNCYRCETASTSDYFGPPWNNSEYRVGENVPMKLQVNLSTCQNAVLSGSTTFTLGGRSKSVSATWTTSSTAVFETSMPAPGGPGSYSAGCSYAITANFTDPSDPNYSRSSSRSGSCSSRTIKVDPGGEPGQCDSSSDGKTYAWNESLGNLCSKGSSSDLSDPGQSGGAITWTCLGENGGQDDSCSATRNARPCTSSPNACGQTANGVYLENGTCSASVPSNPGNYGQSCTATSACGTNSGTYRCDGTCSVSAPAVPGNYGQSCTATSACGTNSGTYRCDGTCSASPPATPGNYGQTCYSDPNACSAVGEGTYRCDGSCSASVPDNPDNYGSACLSPANSCGDVNSGAYQCGNVCSASRPSERTNYGNSCQACNNVNDCNVGTYVCAAGGGVSCNAVAPSNNQPPFVSFGLNAVTEDSYCGIGTPPVFLSWNYSDPENDPQSAYRIIVRQGGTQLIDTGKISSSSKTYAPSNLPFSSLLSWQMKAWDSNGLESLWATGPSIATKSRHPLADFSWSPTYPALESKVRFTDESAAYGGASIVSRFWTFEFGDPATETKANPQTSFTDRGDGGSNAVTLQVADSNGNVCSTQKMIQPTLPLPVWQEVGPGE